MLHKPIVTISRQYGSGGRELGKKLAAQLDIPFYDREIIALAAQESGIHVNIVEQLDETLTRKSLLHLPGDRDFQSLDTLYTYQEEVIRRSARNPCVIVGRCADYILRFQADLVRIFVYADRDSRRKRIISQYGVEERNADAVLKRVDKERAAYYNYHTEYIWGNIEQYDLCINTSIIPIDVAVQVVKQYIDLHP